MKTDTLVLLHICTVARPVILSDRASVPEKLPVSAEGFQQEVDKIISSSLRIPVRGHERGLG